MSSNLATPAERVHFKLHGLQLKAMKLGLKLIPIPDTKVLVGTQATAELAHHIAEAGVKRPLIVTTAGALKRGQIDLLQRSLAAAGLTPAVFSGVTPDPTFAVVNQGVAAQKQNDCDAVIAFGGGSAIDAAKAIAVAATNDKPVAKLIGIRKGKQNPLPVYAVPTTSGTASEVTNVAVVSTDKSHSKRFLIDGRAVSKVAALDPSLSASLPASITAETGMDALTHALESFVSRLSSAESDAFALEAATSIFEHLPVVFEDGSNLASREAMALASLTAGKAFRKTALGYVHAISHQLGARYGLAHGLGNAILLPHVLAYSLPSIQDKLAQLAVKVGIGKTDDSVAELSENMVTHVRALNAQLQIPEKVPGLQVADIPSIANKAYGEAMGMYGAPRYMGRKAIEKLLHALM